MRIGSHHLAYCTNIHRGENWAQTFAALNEHTLAVRERVCPQDPYAIGLRLSDQAARELSDPKTLRAFQRWLDEKNCYVFTINGFPFGKFHGTRVKEQVYLPDWSSPERLEFTNRLFDLLAQIVPEGVEGSVSTVPGSFKEFNRTPAELKQMRINLFRCVEHISQLSEKTGRKLHLGVEPEPLCLFETTEETIEFIQAIRKDYGNDPRLKEFLGVNYDTCHLAVEFEEPQLSLSKFQQAEIMISKLHLSSALKVQPTKEVREELKKFTDDIYLHQVVARNGDGTLVRYRDLDVALNEASLVPQSAQEWRIHFHIPLHAPRLELFENTTDHLVGVFDVLQKNPKLCSHLEMETYTWEVMPAQLKNRSVVDQLVGEYRWCLGELSKRGLLTN
jgi:hypothetical protein